MRHYLYLFRYGTVDSFCSQPILLSISRVHVTVSLTESRTGMLCFELHQVSVVMNMQQGAKYGVCVYCACISYAWGTMLMCREHY